MDQKVKDALKSLTLEMAEYIAKYKAYSTDGWTEKEVIKFVWEVLTDVVIAIQNNCKDLTGEEKKLLATEFIKWCYFDEACLNNPRIFGGMPNFVESVVERWVINNVVPDAIEKIVAIFKKYGLHGFGGQKEFMKQIPNDSIKAIGVELY